MKAALLVALSIAVAASAGYWIVSDSASTASSARSESHSDSGSTSRTKAPSQSPSKTRTKSSRASRGADETDMAQRVRRLERRVASLEAQLRVSGSRGSNALDLDDPTSSAQIHEVVEGALADAQAAAESQREERRADRMKDRREQALASLLNAASFSPSSSEQISQAWEAEEDQIRELFNQARAGDLDMRAAREQARAIREETDASAHAMMNDEQRSAYDESRPGPRRGRR